MIIRRIIFVDREDICRAPIAWGLAQKEIQKRDLDITVSSAGTDAPYLSPPTRNTLVVSREIGLDLKKSRSKMVDEGVGDSNTLFVAMDERQASWLKRVMLVPSDRVTVLGSGVSEPYGKDLELYRRTLDELSMAITALFDRLRGELPVLQREPVSADKLQNLAEEGYEILSMSYSELERVTRLEKEIFSDCWSEISIKESIESEGIYFLVVKKDSELCGYGCVMVAADTAYIPKLAVAKEHRRKGLAYTILSQLCEAADRDGANEVVLDVRASNVAAIELYKSSGFELEGRKPNSYENPKEDALVFSKRLGMIAEPVRPPSNFSGGF